MSIDDLLPKKSRDQLRAAFDNDTLIQLGIDSVTASYDRSLPMTALSASQFYAESDQSPHWSTDPQLTRVMSRANIERVLLPTLLMTKQRWAFAIHVYWAMMVADEPLTPSEIAEIVLLVSMYGGLAVSSEGMNVLTGVLKLLNDRVVAGQPLDAKSCIGAIAGYVPISPGAVYALKS